MDEEVEKEGFIVEVEVEVEAVNIDGFGLAC